LFRLVSLTMVIVLRKANLMWISRKAIFIESTAIALKNFLKRKYARLFIESIEQPSGNIEIMILTFREEYVDLLNEHGVEFDEKYLL
jgi:hypothetical protein